MSESITVPGTLTRQLKTLDIQDSCFVPSELYEPIALLLDEDTPGLLNPGQSFTGTMTDSDWEPLAGAAITVDHNSWFTADIPALLTDPNISETPMVGLAWCTFSPGSVEGDYYQGSYALLPGGADGGVLAIEPSCAPSPMLSAAADILLGMETEMPAAWAGKWPGSASTTSGKGTDVEGLLVPAGVTAALPVSPARTGEQQWRG